MAFVSSEFRLSERTACKLLGVERSSYRYDPRPDRNAELRGALVQRRGRSRATAIVGYMLCCAAQAMR